jgi:hypothetical protein
MLAARALKAGSAPRHVSSTRSRFQRSQRNFSAPGNRLPSVVATTSAARVKKLNQRNFASQKSAAAVHGSSSTSTFVVLSDWQRLSADITSTLNQLESRGPLEEGVAKFFTSGQLPHADDLFGFDAKFAAQYLQDDPEQILHKTLDDLIRASITKEILVKAHRQDRVRSVQTSSTILIISLSGGSRI